MKIRNLKTQEHINAINKTRKGDLIILKPDQFNIFKQKTTVKLLNPFECFARIVRPARFKSSFTKPVKGTAYSFVKGKKVIFNFCPRTQVQEIA